MTALVPKAFVQLSPINHHISVCMCVCVCAAYCHVLQQPVITGKAEKPVHFRDAFKELAGTY